MHSDGPTAIREQPEGISFGPFCLTSAPLRLWRGRREVKLQPRPLAVLRYLVEHAGAVVSREEFWRAVWKGTVVTPSALQRCIRTIRIALGDAASTPRYIETMGREGYRFISAAQRPKSQAQRDEENPQAKGEEQKAEMATQFSAPSVQSRSSTPVGRETELAQMHALLDKVQRGERQLVFVTGEAGIGKTTLVDTFLTQRASPVTLWFGRGQCVEHYTEGEAYLPVLEAVSQLCQEPDGADFLAALRRYAPTWLLHLPSVVGTMEREALRRQGAGATRGQMLREMAEALEAVSAEREMVVVLEDLHVSDPSTVELLAYLAQRRMRARLMLIGTYRPVDVAVNDHPLWGCAQELHARGYSQRIALELLTEAEVAAYLSQRLAPSSQCGTLASQIWQRTDGNPLFVVSMVEYLLQQGQLIADGGRWRLAGDLASCGVPDTLQHLIAKQLDGLPADQQRILEVASAVGASFTTASVAAVEQTTVQAVDEECDELAQRGQFIAAQGLAEWPDGTVSGQYEFRHVLYRDVLYQRLGAGRCARAHLAIGVREEAGYGARASERAAELAQHFTQGRAISRAAPYLLQAGLNALRRSAPVEALSYFKQGLRLMATQPETLERAQQELWLQTGLVTAQSAAKGFGAEVERALLRAHVLRQRIEKTPKLVPVLAGLWAIDYARGELRTARQLAEQTCRLAHDAHEAALLGAAQANLQATLYHQGELATAQVQGEQAVALIDASSAPLLAFGYGLDLRVRTRTYAATTLYALGYADQARRQSRELLVLARELGHGQTLAAALQFTAGVYGACREWAEMQSHAAELMTVAMTQGLPFWCAQGLCSRGIALAQQGDVVEGISQIRQGVAICRATGAMIGMTRILGWLAEAYGQAGQIAEGVQVLEEALTVVERGDERIWEAELYRRKGELSLQSRQAKDKSQASQGKSEIANLPTANPHVEAEAEACFLKAIAIARQQQAKSFELRAVMALSRLWQSQGRKGEAFKLLTEIYDWFTEGFDTKDLQEAKALIEKNCKGQSNRDAL